jgi:hypothetical protein
VNAEEWKRTISAPDPDIRRIKQSSSDHGKYLVIKNDKVEARFTDFVRAELKAHELARAHPSYRVVVAKCSLEVIGVPHVYEVQPN